MNLIEFIGFIISLLALSFLFFRQRYETRYKREYPKEYALRQKKREQALREYSNLMGIPVSKEEEKEEERENEYEDEEMEEEIPVRKSSSIPSNPLKKTSQSYTYTEQKEHSKLVNAPSYEVHRFDRQSRASILVQKLSSKQELLIYKEILDKPMSLRIPSDEHL